MQRLMEAIGKSIQGALETGGAGEVMACENEQIERVVYGAYTPKLYKRRYYAGGLLDLRNYKVRKAGHLIGIANETRSKQSGQTSMLGGEAFSLSRLIYGGDGYMGYRYTYPRRFEDRDAGRYPYLKPRDFITPTVLSLKQGRLAGAVADELRTRGYKAR